MPRMKTETYGSGDMSWLASDHGIRDCRTETINAADWLSVAVAGTVLSGYPAAKVGGYLVPYDKTEGVTTNAGVLAGHIFTDQAVFTGAGKIPVPLYDHGRVNAAKVPLASFVKPAAAAKNATNILYV